MEHGHLGRACLLSCCCPDNMVFGGLGVVAAIAGYGAMQDCLDGGLPDYTASPSQQQDSTDLTAANFDSIVYDPSRTVAVLFTSASQDNGRFPPYPGLSPSPPPLLPALCSLYFSFLLHMGITSRPVWLPTPTPTPTHPESPAESEPALTLKSPLHCVVPRLQGLLTVNNLLNILQSVVDFFCLDVRHEEVHALVLVWGFLHFAGGLCTTVALCAHWKWEMGNGKHQELGTPGKFSGGYSDSDSDSTGDLCVEHCTIGTVGLCVAHLVLGGFGEGRGGEGRGGEGGCRGGTSGLDRIYCPPPPPAKSDLLHLASTTRTSNGGEAWTRTYPMPGVHDWGASLYW